MSRPSMGAWRRSAHTTGGDGSNAPKSHAFARLARVLLCLGAMPLLSSCLVDDRRYPPPEPPEVQGPTIRTFDAQPAFGEVKDVCREDTLKVVVKFQYERADDAKILSRMWVSPRAFSVDEESLEVTWEEFTWNVVTLTEDTNLAYTPARDDIGLDFETVNTVTINWPVAVGTEGPGLYRLKLVLHHEGNALNGRTPSRRSEADAITWDVFLHGPGERGCPQ